MDFLALLLARVSDTGDNFTRLHSLSRCSLFVQCKDGVVWMNALLSGAQPVVRFKSAERRV